ncbi:UNVERIFIED_CONTAM: hypothetical protein GTU68_036249 [Idotea baltica]|nr:hypothetical protein [Idotea baltica]
MGSMHTGLEEAPNGFDRMAAYYAERAKGGVSLIITGGIAPNESGKIYPRSAVLNNTKNIGQHQIVTNAVHAADAKICLQILHAGRYSFTKQSVAPSAIPAPNNPFTPKELTKQEIESQIEDFVQCAVYAQKAQYDGVEVMGSEGYLINQFLVRHTNHRADQWGGSYLNRMRFPLTIVSRIREAVGPNFIIIYRLSMLDLINLGSNWNEIVQLAQQLESHGVTLINTGIGWHEARIPTIITQVPRAAFISVTAKLRQSVTLPVIATNRINIPTVAEKIIAEGGADMISMARPFLADPDFMNKAKQGRADEINTCIACNQACLDSVFKGGLASCLVNPRACNETSLYFGRADKIKKIAVIGAGLAGLSMSITAAKRGHKVTLFDALSEVGGQFNLAKCIPGKSEFGETLRYFKKQLELNHVNVHLNRYITARELVDETYDDIIIATGTTPKVPVIEGINHPKVVSYIDVLTGKIVVGKSVAIIGAGGIGFDLADFLTAPSKFKLLDTDIKLFWHKWGIDTDISKAGGLADSKTVLVNTASTKRTVFLLQRKASKIGQNLGKTTGWVHRANLKAKQVIMQNNISYLKIDHKGLHIQQGSSSSQVLEVDHIIICCGQEPRRELHNELTQSGLSSHLIGGAYMAKELDAQQAISQGMSLANKI